MRRVFVVLLLVCLAGCREQTEEPMAPLDILDTSEPWSPKTPPARIAVECVGLEDDSPETPMSITPGGTSCGDINPVPPNCQWECKSTWLSPSDSWTVKCRIVGGGSECPTGFTVYGEVNHITESSCQWVFWEAGGGPGPAGVWQVNPCPN